MALLGWLLANWRLLGFAAVVVALGAVVAFAGIQTVRLQNLQAEFAYFRLELEADAREAKAKADATNAHNALVNEELEHDIQHERQERAAERAARSDRFAALYGKYHGMLNDNPGRGVLPEAGAGPAGPVHTGLTVCFDRARLTAGLRGSLDALHGELEPLLERGADGLDDAGRWGQWARLVGACKKP